MEILRQLFPLSLKIRRLRHTLATTPNVDTGAGALDTRGVTHQDWQKCMKEQTALDIDEYPSHSLLNGGEFEFESAMVPNHLPTTISSDQGPRSLRILIIQLKDRLSAGNAIVTLRRDAVLLSNVLQEVEIWSADEGTPMSVKAQITLAHSLKDPATAFDYLDWGQKPALIAASMYLHLVERACLSGIFSSDVVERLCFITKDMVNRLLSQKEMTQDLDRRLSILHRICDYYVAYCSVSNAIEHLISSLIHTQCHSLHANVLLRYDMAANQQRDDDFRLTNKAIQATLELLMSVQRTEQTPVLNHLSFLLVHRFTQFGEMGDLDIAFKCLQEAVDLAPNNSDEHETALAVLNHVNELRSTTEVAKHHSGAGVEMQAMSLLATPYELKDLLSRLRLLVSELSRMPSLDDIEPLRADQILLCNICHEIETWINESHSQMAWSAQIALAHSAVEGSKAIGYLNWGVKSAEIPMRMYLHLMKRACKSGRFGEEVQVTLQGAIQDAENWLRSTNKSTPSDDYAEQLAILQTIGDASVACNSMVEAVNHGKTLLTVSQTKPRILNVLDRVQMAVEQADSDFPELLSYSIQTLSEFAMFQEGEEKSGILAALGFALYRRFLQLGERKDIDDGIQQGEDALRLTAIGGDNRPTYHCSLAESFQARFTRFGSIDDICLAITHFQDAVHLASPKNEVYPSAICGLASSLRARFERLGDIEDIHKAIKLWRKALSFLPVDSEDHIQCLTQLGNALLSRSKRTGHEADIDPAIQWLRRAEKYLPSNLSEHLGAAFLIRYDRFGKVEDLETSLLYNQRAVELTQSGSSTVNLAFTFTRRFERFGEIKDLDGAIEVGQKALDAIPLDHPDRPRCLSNLGSQFQIRFERLKQGRDLDNALAYHLQAFNLTHPDTSHRVTVIMSLSNYFAERYNQHLDMADIDQAIMLSRMATGLCHVESPNRWMILHNLGQNLMTRYGRLCNVEDLEVAIQLQREVASLRPSRPTVHGLMSKLLLLRYTRSKQPTDFELAIDHSQQAVSITPPDHYHYSQHLCLRGRLLMRRSQDTQRPQDLRNAISAYRSACLSVYGAPKWRLVAAWEWACHAHRLKYLESAAEAYYHAVRLLPLVVWIGLGATSQLAQITENSKVIQNLACDAAACMISLAESRPDRRQHYLGKAVELLDQARSIIWSQTSNLRQDMTNLRKVDPDLAQEIDQVGKLLSGRCFDDQAESEAEARGHRRSAQRWDQLVNRVRSLPGFASFLLPFSISELRQTAKIGPVIIVNESKHRSDVVIIPCTGDLILLPLSRRTASQIRSTVSQARESARRIERARRAGGPASVDSLQAVLHSSWTTLGEPVLHELTRLNLVESDDPSKPLSRVWWCLSGPLTSLPIHAAHPPPVRLGEQPLGMMDLVVSSYTPTLSVLLRSQRDLPPNKSCTVQMLAIGRSDELPMVKEELDTIRRLFRNHKLTVLEREHATIDAVSDHLPACTWVHFACHGLQDHNEPMKSGLKMYDKLLTLSRLARTPLPLADFAFLSCCQSATGSDKYVNESVHLAAGLQFVGFRSVVGTLWSVGDREAELVAEQVYRGLFAGGVINPSSSCAAVMLNRAIRYLRDKHKVSYSHLVPFVHFGI